MRASYPQRFLLIVVLALGSVPRRSTAFQFPTPKASKNPDLLRHVGSQAGTLLNLRFDLGPSDKSVPASFHLSGLLLELASQVPCNKDDGAYPRMPGSHGPDPRCSSGCFQVNVLKEGAYVDMNGSQHVSLQHGVWEMNWRDDAPAGSIVCGFKVPQEYKRNEAVLPKGNLYVAFPVFTMEGLDKVQKHKAETTTQMKALEEEFEEHRGKMMSTHNPLMKALHFRNAYAAREKHSFTNFQWLKMVPTNEEVVDIGGGLVIADKGTVWTKVEKGFGSRSQVLLGTAFVSSGPATNKQLP